MTGEIEWTDWTTAPLEKVLNPHPYVYNEERAWKAELERARAALKSRVQGARESRVPGSLYNNPEQMALAAAWVRSGWRYYMDAVKMVYGRKN